jgi:hypothetical protein
MTREDEVVRRLKVCFNGLRRELKVLRTTSLKGDFLHIKRNRIKKALRRIKNFMEIIQLSAKHGSDYSLSLKTNDLLKNEYALFNEELNYSLTYSNIFNKEEQMKKILESKNFPKPLKDFVELLSCKKSEIKTAFARELKFIFEETARLEERIDILLFTVAFVLTEFSVSEYTRLAVALLQKMNLGSAILVGTVPTSVFERFHEYILESKRHKLFIELVERAENAQECLNDIARKHQDILVTG